METNAEWRQLGAVVSDVMERLQTRRLEQQRFIAESHAEVMARALAPSRPMRSVATPRQMELPLFIARDPRARVCDKFNAAGRMSAA